MNPPPIKVLVNGLHAKSGGGVTYLCNLLPHLAGDTQLDLHLFLHESQRNVIGPVDARIHTRYFDFPNGFRRLLLWEQIVLPREARKLGVRVTFSPANFGPLWAPGPVILLRNALAVADSEDRAGKRLYWAALGFMTRASLRTCRRAIAVSGYAKDALTRGLDSRIRDRVTVVHHGVSPTFSPPPPDSPRGDDLLAVGDIYIQKNFHGLLEALHILKRELPQIRLRIAGRPVDADYANRITGMVASLGLEDSVEFLGHVPPDGLVTLYRECGLFVFPSLAETFGNPLAEAMACGAPIASSDATAMPEVLDGAGELFDPSDPQAMAAVIARILRDPDLRKALGERSRKRGEAFSWKETARKTGAILKGCA